MLAVFDGVVGALDGDDAIHDACAPKATGLLGGSLLDKWEGALVIFAQQKWHFAIVQQGVASDNFQFAIGMLGSWFGVALQHQHLVGLLLLRNTWHGGVVAKSAYARNGVDIEHLDVLSAHVHSPSIFDVGGIVHLGVDDG